MSLLLLILGLLYRHNNYGAMLMSKPLYTCFLISECSRNTLISLFPPKYQRVIGHHVTFKFGNVSEDDVPPESDIRVVGYVDSGDGIEALLVTVNGRKERHSGGLYHITWSIEGDYRPVDSNHLIASKIDDIQWFENSISVSTTPSLVRG